MTLQDVPPCRLGQYVTTPAVSGARRTARGDLRAVRAGLGTASGLQKRKALKLTCESAGRFLLGPCLGTESSVIGAVGALRESCCTFWPRSVLLRAPLKSVLPCGVAVNPLLSRTLLDLDVGFPVAGRRSRA